MVTLHICHRTGTKRSSIYFLSKIWRHHRCFLPDFL